MVLCIESSTRMERSMECVSIVCVCLFGCLVVCGLRACMFINLFVSLLAAWLVCLLVGQLVCVIVLASNNCTLLA